MPKRKVLSSISLGRGVITTKNSRGGEDQKIKELIELVPGQVFDFTADEITEIENAMPGILSKNVSTDVETGEMESTEVLAAGHIVLDEKGKPVLDNKGKPITTKDGKIPNGTLGTNGRPVAPLGTWTVDGKPLLAKDDSL